MCGFLKPSLGHARRICRILCSEWWRQVRFFHDCLVVACSTETTYRQQGSLQEWRATTKRVTEFLWNVVRPTLPTKKKKGRPQGDIRVLGDCSVPEKVRNVLCLGPKFAFEPKVPPAERVALSRSISRFVPEGEQASIVYSALRAVIQKTCTHSPKESFLSQIEKLQTAGYPEVEILRACHKLISSQKARSNGAVYRLYSEQKGPPPFCEPIRSSSIPLSAHTARSESTLRRIG
ncbi:hypothetical protein HPB50_026522 [Hyalomma asiaticum]|uniref:Uncharacterized protein n=1 Tax=Hyalomma asiaticum TaxID=266040 RepID=A0ACB7S5J2_HYAAI|nr:hypothetical protein HPB50_026522 [Hyalomma asiaticum]